MAIRLRVVDGYWIAVCAARSVEQPGDIYLHDGLHHALTIKFDLDHCSERQLAPWSADAPEVRLMEQEESNNPARTWWDQEYGHA